MYQGTRGRFVFVAALCTAAMLLLAVPAAQACPNDLLRGGPSSLLPDCRAYEMVSPPDKNNGDVDSFMPLRSAPSGDAVLFASTTAFAGAPSSPLYGFYVSRRGGGDWSTESIEAPQLHERGNMFTVSVASPDLGKTLQVSRMALAPGAIEGGSNLYIRDNLSGERTLVAARPEDDLYERLAALGGAPYLAGAPDWSNLLFSLPVPGAPLGVNDLYEYDEGELRIVNRLPDGTVFPDGAYIGYFGSTLPRAHAISEDGSRVFFNTGRSAHSDPLYMRRDGEVTVPVSESQRPGEEGTVANAQFGGAAADGSVVYFLSAADLTEDSQTGGRPSLYRYEVGTGELRDLTIAPQLPEGAWVSDVLALSEDGSHVYFSAVGDLTGEAPESPFDANLYLWHENEIEWIGATSGDAFEFAGPSNRLASPNGRYFAFSAFTALTPDDVPSPSCPMDPEQVNPPEACEDVYLYDSGTGELTCVSCDGPGLGFSSLGVPRKPLPGLGDEFPRAVLDDGTVFFDSPNRLLAADVDALGDVYSWQQGELALLSPATDAAAANFGEATADGRTVFIRTAEPLLSRDVDASVDVYAAREGGGLAAQRTTPGSLPCASGDCRGGLPAAAAPPPISTGSAQARSTLPRRCAKLRRRGVAALRAASRLDGGRAQRKRAAAKRALRQARRCARSAR
ncbi:MAG TPA: hypothetical protein VD761_05775 [Solirubrobacterales bacterium]|nr:hypothetical protein [Solirubrobacterales bacterium]